MKFVIFGAVASLLATVVCAEPLETNNIVAATTGDWNSDGAQDLVLLTRGADAMDLQFYLQDKDYQFLKLVDVARGKIWGTADPNGMVGQAPEIKALPNGSITVYTHNDAIGRDRWTSTLTLAYRNTDFVVAGFTYTYYDTLDPNNSGDCDLNVLTGKGIANRPDGKGGTMKVNFSIQPQFMPFKNWPEDGGMKECGIN